MMISLQLSSVIKSVAESLMLDGKGQRIAKRLAADVQARYDRILAANRIEE